VPGQLSDQARQVAASLETELAPADLARLLVAWTQLFGAVSFELFGQYVGSADPADAFFSYNALLMADFVGLS
jgi:hypothetical protein